MLQFLEKIVINQKQFFKTNCVYIIIAGLNLRRGNRASQMCFQRQHFETIKPAHNNQVNKSALLSADGTKIRSIYLQNFICLVSFDAALNALENLISLVLFL